MQRKPAKVALITAIVVIGCAQVIFIADQLSEGRITALFKPTENTRSVVEDVGARSTAYQLAKEHIRRRLNYPNTARFPSMADEGVTFSAEGTDAIRVDAHFVYKNGLDMAITSKYYAVISFEGSDVRVRAVDFKDNGRFVKPREPLPY